MVNQGDLWGSEDSDADMIDDYGADSNSEDEDDSEGEEVRFISESSGRDPCLLESFQIPVLQ